MTSGSAQNVTTTPARAGRSQNCTPTFPGRARYWVVSRDRAGTATASVNDRPSQSGSLQRDRRSDQTSCGLRLPPTGRLRGRGRAAAPRPA